MQKHDWLMIIIYDILIIINTNIIKVYNQLSLYYEIITIHKYSIKFQQIII